MLKTHYGMTYQRLQNKETEKEKNEQRRKI